MSADTPTKKKIDPTSPTRFFLKGLAISLPPILTLVILFWIGQGIYGYVISPISTVVRYTIAQIIDNSEPTKSTKESDKQLETMPGLPPLDYWDRTYRITRAHKEKLERKLAAPQKTEILFEDLDPEQVYIPIGDGERSVPYTDYELVAKNVAPAEMPTRVIGSLFDPGIYMEVVTHEYFFGLFHLSAVAVILTVMLLYFLGRFVTARIGAWAVQKTETVFLAKVPLISHVYSSVKQVTDFFFSERTVEYNRVVALEYPRRGIWSMGFVTSDSMLEITVAAGEPLVSVLMPTSPMPMTGFTVNVPRSEVIDLNITIDQAFQYCLSCGVLIPEQQKVSQELLQKELARRLTGEDEPAKKSDQRQPTAPPQPTLIEDSPKDSP